MECSRTFVNLAYYTREDCSSDSFRSFVLRRLSNSAVSEDTSLWGDYIGFPTLQTLVEHFDAEDIPGRPYRYVRPIMQQAGVPFSTINQFVNFFLQLAQQYGVPFSFQDYKRFRANHQVVVILDIGAIQLVCYNYFVFRVCS